MDKLIPYIVFGLLIICGAIFAYFTYQFSVLFLVGFFTSLTICQLYHYLHYGKLFNPSVDDSGNMMSSKQELIIAWAEEAARTEDLEVSSAVVTAAQIVVQQPGPLKVIRG